MGKAPTGPARLAGFRDDGLRHETRRHKITHHVSRFTHHVLRIAFVAPFGLGQKTTVWARTLPLAKELVRHGHTVMILIPPWDTPADSGRAWEDEGVTVVNLQVAGGLPLMLWRMLLALRQFDPTHVHIVKPRAHAGMVQWLLWQWRKLRGKGPQILLDVDDWEQAWAPINHYAAVVARFLAWQEEWGIRHADGITAASHWLVERMQHDTPSTPVLYLPNGITLVNAKHVGKFASHHATNHQILFYSRYVEVSPTWLANFWKALHAQMPTATTLIVFGDALEAGRPTQFRAAMQHHAPNAAKQITWQAYDPTLVDQLYQQSACAIFPATPTPLHEAKCSVRLATTLLRGIPVVASAVGEQQYYGADGAAALVAADATPEEFAEEVRQVLTNPEARLQAQQQAEARLLRDYNWHKLGDALTAFYAEVQRGFLPTQE